MAEHAAPGSAPVAQAAGNTPGDAGNPSGGGLILASLILVAAVANLNLSVANVALPSIGLAFTASQTSLDLVAVGYSLGLAASVLWLGAIGDRYGRKMLLLLGIGLSIPACLVAAFAPTIEVLIVARIVGGISAGMAYPTTLALITALWAPGPGRTKSIALWSALGGAIAALGPLVAGFLLERFDWGSVFLITLPLAAVALFMAWRFVPAHVNETVDPVDNLGGILSAVLVGTLILAINFAPVPNMGALVIGLAAHLRRRDGRVRHPPTSGEGSALRPGHRRSADILGRRAGRHHRLRIADGRDVHRPAIPPERPAVLDLRGRDGDHPGCPGDGPRRTPVGGHRRGSRSARDPPLRLRLRDGRLPDDAAALGRGQQLPRRGSRLRACRGGGRARRNPRVKVPDRLGAGHASRHGVRDRRPSARPRRRDHAVDLRGVADGRLRGRCCRRAGGGSAESRSDDQRAEPAHDVVRGCGGHRRTVPAVQRPDHRGRQGGVPGRRPVGLPGRHRRRPPGRDARLLQVPAQGRGASAAGVLPEQDTVPARPSSPVSRSPSRSPAPTSGQPCRAPRRARRRDPWM